MSCVTCTESLKKDCPRLREIAPAARGGITQPRKSFFEGLCMCDATVAAVASWKIQSKHSRFLGSLWLQWLLRDTKKIIFKYILQNSYAPFLKYLYHKFLSGFPRNTWCRGLWQDLTPFLESSEFSMSCNTTFWAQKCLFVVKILSRSCNFWCTWKNE